MRAVWSLKYRAAILERNPALQLLRIVEAYGAIQRQLEKLEKNSPERQKLDNAINTLDRLRKGDLRPQLDELRFTTKGPLQDGR
jgi:hypothetical protein